MTTATATAHTRVIFIIDSSGSMYSKTSDVIGGFNNFIADLRQREGSYSVMAVRFDTTVTTMFADTPLTEVIPINETDYHTSGNTALLDAIGTSIAEVQAQPGEKILVIIQTDGYENSSTHFTKEQIRQMIEERKALPDDQWGFLFLGADMDRWAAEQAAGGLGIARGSTVAYASANTGTTFSSVSDAASAYSAGQVQADSLGQAIVTDDVQ